MIPETNGGLLTGLMVLVEGGIKINGHTTVTATSHQSLPVCPAWCPVLPFMNFSHCHATLGMAGQLRKWGCLDGGTHVLGGGQGGDFGPGLMLDSNHHQCSDCFLKPEGPDCQTSPPSSPVQTLWRLGNSRLPWTHTHSP